MRAYDFYNEGNTNYKIELKFFNIFQIFILCFGMITLLRLSCLYLYNRVRYVCFTTNLSLLSKKKTFNQHNFSLIFLSLLTLGLLVELENNYILLFVVLMNPNAGRLMNSFLKFTIHFYYLIPVYVFYCYYSSYLHLKPFCVPNLDLSFEKSVPLGAHVTHFDVKRHSFEPWTHSQPSK